MGGQQVFLHLVILLSGGVYEVRTPVSSYKMTECVSADPDSADQVPDLCPPLPGLGGLRGPYGTCNQVHRIVGSTREGLYFWALRRRRGSPTALRGDVIATEPAPEGWWGPGRLDSVGQGPGGIRLRDWEDVELVPRARLPVLEIPGVWVWEPLKLKTRPSNVWWRNSLGWGPTSRCGFPSHIGL